MDEVVGAKVVIVVEVVVVVVVVLGASVTYFRFTLI